MRRGLIIAFDWVVTLLAWGLVAVIVSALLTRSIYTASDTTERVRFHIRDTEFDFVGWTFDAVGVQLRQNTVGQQLLLDETARSQLVRSFFNLRAELDDIEAQISTLYADPNVADPLAATTALRARQSGLRHQMRQT